MLADILLVALCLFVFALGVTLVQHLFLTVPFIPTPARTVEAMIDAAELRGRETVCDLGAGDGRFLLAVKKRFPEATAYGCELVWAVWLLGTLRIALAGTPVRLMRGSVYHADVSHADVVFLYLFPSMMQRLGEKFDRELRPGTRVISHAFRFPGREPERVVERDGKKIIVYRW